MDSTKKIAQKAGLLYLSLVAPAAYGLMYVPSQIMVQGDPAATSDKLLAHEFLFRTGITSQLISSVLILLVALTLYRLLKQVNEQQAKLMVALVIVQVPMAFLNEAFNITALMILKGEVLKTVGLLQKQEIAMLFLKIHRYGLIVLQIFWGLWLLPFGQLVYKSGFIPRLFGILLIINGIAYVLVSLTFLLFPDYRALVNQYAFVFYSIGEPAIILWLLIKGVKDKTDRILSA